MDRFFVGIDIQEKRKCCFAVLQHDGTLVESGWLSEPAKDSVTLVQKLKGLVAVGIDAPRQPLLSPRKWFWNKKEKWTERTTQRGYGRHCEAVINAHGLANPQWTPIKQEVPTWMKIGFDIYSSLNNILPSVHEVFPTASYSLLWGVKDVRIEIDFSSCRPGPKDILDAAIAAVTVREFLNGKGFEVGGGDGLGTIVIPRPLPDPVIEDVLFWPEEKS